jgi:uncharacterized protein (DUF2252 family)
MSRSSHSYVRGSTQKFYEWLYRRAGTGFRMDRRSGFVVIAMWKFRADCQCQREIDIQIRDLDQTGIGNPAHDLIRLALSLASAARGSDLLGVITVKMVENLVEGYEQALKKADNPIKPKSKGPR